MPGDLLIENCSVLEGDTRSILVSDGLVTRLSAEQRQDVPVATRVDAGGATVLPGLIDSHCNLITVGAMPRTLNLADAASIHSIRLRVSAAVARTAPGGWIVGEGWDEERLAEGRAPAESDIDDLTKKNPLLLRRVCGTVGLFNRAAQEALGAEARGLNESHGLAAGETLDELTSMMPQPPSDEVEASILAGEYEAARNGITAVHSFLSSNFVAEVQAYANLRRNGLLSLRHRVFLPVEALDSGILDTDWSDQTFRINGVWMAADGSLGARTAALEEVYSDDHSRRGTLRYSDEQMAALAGRVVERGLQVAVRAEGDAAVGQCARVLGAVCPPAGRPRLEHASLFPSGISDVLAAGGTRRWYSRTPRSRARGQTAGSAREGWAVFCVPHRARIGGASAPLLTRPSSPSAR